MLRSKTKIVIRPAVQVLAGLPILLLAAAASAQTVPAASPPAFVDVTETSNISYRVGYTRPYLLRETRAVSESTFGGAAAGDCDQDGDIDLFIT